MALENAKRNGFDDGSMKWIEANVFEALREFRDKGEQFDLVILDPPKFASSHHHVDKAARAYKDINLNGLRILAPGGQLLTFSCSGAIDVDLFQKIVAGARHRFARRGLDDGASRSGNRPSSADDSP